MNLIITCARRLEPETEGEVRGILEKFGDPDAEVSITRMSGILTASTRLEPVGVVREIREMILDEPWSVRYCLKVIPIQKVVKTGMGEMEKISAYAAGRISDGETYQISVKKRDSSLSSQEIISRVAAGLKNKVSLEFPDKVVLIEILGNMTGVSVVKKSDVLSVEKTKRSISE